MALSVEILYEFFDNGGFALYLQYLPVPLNVVNPWKDCAISTTLLQRAVIDAVKDFFVTGK
jgi:hypothetical protein